MFVIHGLTSSQRYELGSLNHRKALPGAAKFQSLPSKNPLHEIRPQPEEIAANRPTKNPDQINRNIFHAARR
jgi:hypothetical protein